MKVYIKFISLIFFKSLFFVFFVILSLVFLLNLLTELEFFKNLDVPTSFTLFLSLLNSPALIFEMFPFIMLITVQLTFIKLFENQEIEIFKYSGLKNSKILSIISVLSLFTGIIVITIFYNLSSNLKNIYLELKSNYSSDGKYLAVVTKNGLWIKDKIDNKIIMTNAARIDDNFILANFITEFDENFNIIRNIKSKKIDISSKKWKIFNARVYYENEYLKDKDIELRTNFDLKRIKSLYSNLSALNIYALYELRKNYKKLNYSLTDVDLHLYKLTSNPLYLVLIAIFSSLIMLRIKKFKSTTFKISIGLFFSVVIYYLNNFSYVLGSAERISIVLSTFIPLIILSTINIFMIYKINDK
ncbi:LptF/LptG family permease [Candidatus Pelagibacter sp.]|nr:LptF/LptG family permease [Candidatus Pelagibacter sp.]